MRVKINPDKLAEALKENEFKYQGKGIEMTRRLRGMAAATALLATLLSSNSTSTCRPRHEQGNQDHFPRRQ
ncbi:MAG: hypothetical protein WCH43_14755, partial [Verrucomicrobiota bacterium]